ncbi:extracellular solute-binding protein [Georgenia sp. EYE_87]|uniref:ABC transporter substrate-binding protein n=1 Tax=Georgenia sp. EYE_87 TaxID=2853448 RepID=UPI002004E610|nr:extracellular solute-binding protein [Georgenia sp. EYE_87]MCK6211111.1 extracellular solute-binding protein [Georgenia sp. EYE_87]
MSRRRLQAAVGLTGVASMVAACAAGAEGRTELVFFQFKPEAVQYFEELADRFEEENPDIRIVVDNVPDPETALRTRLVKEDVPDVMTLNANATFGELASGGIFKDFSDEPILDGVSEDYVQVIEDLGASEPGAVNGVPFAANASGVLYNVELFEEHGVEVPTTWPELVEAAETFEAAGITPFYAMLLDAWTAQSPMAPLIVQTTPEDFWEQRFAGETSFSEAWPEGVEKLATLYDYTQPDPLAFGYQEGTRAFAQGESAMLLLGSYAVPQVRSFEPGFTVGSFALPGTDDPADTVLVSGVDVVITAAADGPHEEEAQRFIDFLMQPDVVQEYTEQQVAIPALEELANDDPALEGVQSYIEEGRIVGFFDHQFIPAIPLAPLLQQYLIDRDVEAFLGGLDDNWDRVAARRTWGLGAVQE